MRAWAFNGFFGIKHGSALSVRKRILGISTVTAYDLLGVAAAEAIDRMRDLVRRAILARLCLASGEQPLWPFNPSSGMDVAFADDAVRATLRLSWRRKLAELGAVGVVESLGTPSQAMVEDFGSACTE